MKVSRVQTVKIHLDSMIYQHSGVVEGQRGFSQLRLYCSKQLLSSAAEGATTLAALAEAGSGGGWGAGGG